MSLLVNPIFVTPLLKIPLILSAITSTQLGTTQPHPPAEQHERKKYNRDALANAPFNFWITSFVVVRGFGFGCGLCDAAVILAKQFPSSISTNVLSVIAPHPGSADRIQITPIFLAGWALAFGGGLLRIWCYRTLGRFFTFELSLRENHSLVTSGPYSIVRHPAYLGTTMLTIGSLLTNLGPGSWFRECGFVDTITGKLLGAGYAAMGFAITGLLWSRVDQEDAVLEKEFKEDWQVWARRTPYKIIPLLF